MHCIEGYWNAWHKHDAHALTALYCPDGAYWDPLTEQRLRGAAIGEHASMLWTALPDLRFAIMSSHEMGGFTAVAWTLHGTCTGPWMGLSPTEQTIRLMGATLFQTSGGQIQRAYSYFDVRTLLEQLDF